VVLFVQFSKNPQIDLNSPVVIRLKTASDLARSSDFKRSAMIAFRISSYNEENCFLSDSSEYVQSIKRNTIMTIMSLQKLLAPREFPMNY